MSKATFLWGNLYSKRNNFNIHSLIGTVLFQITPFRIECNIHCFIYIRFNISSFFRNYITFAYVKLPLNEYPKKNFSQIITAFWMCMSPHFNSRFHKTIITFCITPIVSHISFDDWRYCYSSCDTDHEYFLTVYDHVSTQMLSWRWWSLWWWSWLISGIEKYCMIMYMAKLLLDLLY